MGDLPVRIGRLSDIALGIALVGPHRFAAIARMQETVAILVGRWLVFRRNQRHQPSDFVVTVFGDGAERILLGHQPAVVVIGLELFTTVQLDLTHQPRAVVVEVNLFTAIDVQDRNAAVVIPDITRIHLRKRRPVPDAARCLARPFPRPEETRATGQLPLQDHVPVVVIVTLAFPGGVARFDQMSAFVVAVTDQRLLGVPGLGEGLRRDKKT